MRGTSTVRNSDLKAERQRRTEALKKLNEGIKLYDEAWRGGQTFFEDDDNLKLLHRAASKFSKSLSLDPENPEMIKYSKLIHCKLTGDEKLKKGRTCQRQAAEAFRQKNYEFAYTRYADAMADFSSAMEHFEEGMMKGQDPRFKPVYKFALNELQLAMGERDVVKPFKEADDLKREAERPYRKQILEEQERKMLEELRKEEEKRRMTRGFLGTGATVGSLALLSTGGPVSNSGESSGSFGISSHRHGNEGVVMAATSAAASLAGGGIDIGGFFS